MPKSNKPKKMLTRPGFENVKKKETKLSVNDEKLKSDVTDTLNGIGFGFDGINTFISKKMKNVGGHLDEGMQDIFSAFIDDENDVSKKIQHTKDNLKRQHTTKDLMHVLEKDLKPIISSATGLLQNFDKDSLNKLGHDSISFVSSALDKVSKGLDTFVSKHKGDESLKMITDLFKLLLDKIKSTIGNLSQQFLPKPKNM